MKRTPLKSRRAKPRRRLAVTCSSQRCRFRSYVGGFCKTHATREADTLFSQAVRARDGICTARPGVPHVVCLGELQCMHLMPRTYHATRWSMDNARAGCAAHHMYLTHRPVEHVMWCEAELGPRAWHELRQRALHGDVPNLGDVLEWLQKAAA